MSAHVRERMSAYIDRELPPAERAGVETHLRECAECAREVEETRAVDALARGQDVEAPTGYFDALPGRLRTRLLPPARARIPAWTMALAAGLVLAVVAPIVWRERPAPTAPRDAERFAPAATAPPAAEPAATELRSAPVPRAFASATPAPSVQDRLARRERADSYAEGGTRAARAPDALAETLTVAPAAPPPAEAAGAVKKSAAPARERGARPFVESAQAQPAPGVAGVDAARGAEADAADADEEEEDATPLVDDSATERDAAGQPPAALAPPAAAKARPGAEESFRTLSNRAARSAAEARALRDAWQAFVRDDPDGSYADDARLRALEAGAAAWRLGGVREDRAFVEREAREYLRRPTGAHKERVRALLAGLEP